MMLLLLLQFLVIHLDEQHYLLEIEFVRFSALEIEEDNVEIGGQ